MIYALADCNNFFCSCERVFHPELRRRPVVVLSNNDGCIIARSNESKALGFKMGDAVYKVRRQLEANRVAVFSSNYTLYGDMSARVMSMLSRYTPCIEPYSIDESFLLMDGVASDSRTLSEYLRGMAAAVERGTGIPISVGVGCTRTLAKMASRFAKRYPGYKGMCMIDTEQQRQAALKLTAIGDVWGIGRHHRRRLEGMGIRTALDFVTRLSEEQVRAMMAVTGVRTWRELQGCDCVDLDELPRKKSICTSRSFPDAGIDTLGVVEEAVANFASQCVRKLRREGSAARAVSVFAWTSRWRTDVPSDYIHSTVTLPVATSVLGEVVDAAVGILRSEWKDDHIYRYKKAGVMVWDICPQECVQLSLFDDAAARSRMYAVQQAIDTVNSSAGYNTVRTAVQGGSVSWHLKEQYLSRHYTTDIRDIIRVS